MLLVALAFLALAQGTPLTNLVLTGAESANLTASDTNACYIGDNNALNVQLTDPASSMIISFLVLGTVGDHPAVNQLTALTLDGPADDLFVNWSAAAGTVSIDDLAAQVPIELGDGAINASTSGVLGHIDADMTSRQGTFHINGQFACHSPT